MERSSRSRRGLLRGLLLVALGLTLLPVPASAQVEPGGTFVDDDGNPHEGAIEALSQAGIVRGCDPPLGNRFCPGRPLLRSEAVALLVRTIEGDEGDADVDLPYDDVPADAWFAPAVATAAERGWIDTRQSHFEPHRPMTRAEAVAVLVRAFVPVEPLPTSTSFADVPPDAWYSGTAEVAFREGLTDGCARDPLRFCPDREVRRDEMATLLSRAADIEPLVPPPVEASLLQALPRAGSMVLGQGEEMEEVVLEGIDPPRPADCRHEIARGVLGWLVSGEPIRVVVTGDEDLVYAGGELVQQRMVEEGWARSERPAHPGLRQVLAEAETVARQAAAGVFGPANPCEATAGPPPNLSVQTAVAPVEYPVHVTAPAGDDRLFVVEQTGEVNVVEDGAVSTFLDITPEIDFGAEQGLLGLAFHPDYWVNGRFFLYYTYEPFGDSRLEEWRVSVDPNRADPSSRKVVLNVDQPHEHHNGGMLTFGPDGMLYLGLGDGGGRFDPHANAQDPSTVLGSILRIDVDGQAPYAIPADNPFADGVEGAPEVWHWGLRNPWRFWFDQVDGTLHIADVGQYEYEEIDVVPWMEAGLNFGWPIREGNWCVDGGSCRSDGLVAPDLTLSHSSGECAVVGGAAYRGTSIAGLEGRSLFTDFCSGRLRSYLSRDAGVTDLFDHSQELGRLERPTSIGTDGRGELYITIHGGTVLAVEPG